MLFNKNNCNCFIHGAKTGDCKTVMLLFFFSNGKLNDFFPQMKILTLNIMLANHARTLMQFYAIIVNVIKQFLMAKYSENQTKKHCSS